MASASQERKAQSWPPAPSFLAGGGEMGARIRAHDWAATPLGPPAGWPAALRMATRLLLNSGHPMHLFWGPELLCLYNDGHIPFVGPDRHPACLGRPAREVWAEAWDVVGPQAALVMAGGGSTWNENQLVPLTRGGAREDAWWTYSYSPIDDPDAPGGVGGVLVIAAETTGFVRERERQAASEARFRAVFENAAVGVARVAFEGERFLEVNGALCAITGYRQDELVGRSRASITHPDDVDADRIAFGRMAAGEIDSYHVEKRCVRRDGRDLWVRLTLSLVRDADGRPDFEICVVEDIDARTRERRARDFAARLADALRPLGDAAAIRRTAARLLAGELGACRVGYAEDGGDGETVEVVADHCVGAPSIVGRYRYDDFGPDLLARLRGGAAVVQEDVANDAGLTAAHKASYAALGIGAVVNQPLVKDGRLVALMAAHFAAARRLTPDETAMIADTAERAWAAVERARAEAALRDSEARFRAVQDTSVDGFMLFESVRDGDGRIADFLCRYANDAGARILGRAREALIGRRLLEAFPGNAESGLFARYARLVEDGRTWTTEGPYRLDGVDAQVRMVAAKASDGFAVTFADISERRAAEKRAAASEARLRESEARFRSMADALPGILHLTSSAGGNLYVNKGYVDYTGLPAAELLGDGWARVLHPDDAAAGFAGWEAAVAAERMYVAEYRVRRRDGAWRWHDARSVPVRDAAGGIVHWVGIAIDVHDRRAAEAALRDGEARLRTVLDSVTDGFYALDADWRLTVCNRAAGEYFGRDPAALLGRPLFAALDAPDTPEARARLEAMLRRASAEVVEAASLVRPERLVELRSAPLPDGGWALSFTDVTERRQAERALRESEARLRAVIDAAPVGLVFADAAGAITGGNRRVEEIVGHPVLPSPDVDGYRAWEGYHPDGRRVEGREYPLARVVAGAAERAELEVLYRRGDGRGAWIRFAAAAIRDANGALLGGVVASLDIDREKRLTEQLEREVADAVAARAEAQRQLFEAQKLETLGQLTGGVAHDFNNLLTPIVSSLDMVRRRVGGAGDADARMLRLIDGALRSAERARVLVQRLLAFARRQTLQPRAVDLAALVEGMADLLARSIGPTVIVGVDVPPGLPPVLADPNQLELAILNLAVNARDAMPGGGALRIAAAANPGPPALAPGRYVRLEVRDDGVGMDADTLARAVEPFFSTKGVGRGTGLGLSMVHGLAAQSGGVFALDSAPGRGTTATLWLPAVEADAAAPEPEPAPPASATRGARVLLVDDEPLVRASTAEALRDLGCDVAEAASAAAALEAVRAGLRPDLLMTDHMMPGMTGAELVATLRARLPGLPAVLITGYADLPPGAADGLALLMKPFRQEDLARALADALDAARPLIAARGDGQRGQS